MLDIIIGIIVIALFTAGLGGAYLVVQDKQRAYILNKNSIALHKRMQGSIDDDTTRSN